MEEKIECFDCGVVVDKEFAVLDVELSPATRLDPPQYGDLCVPCYERRAWREERWLA